MKTNKLKKFAKIILLSASAMTILVSTAGWSYKEGYRINITTSLPPGIWKINTNYTEIKKGDYIWFRPSQKIINLSIEKGLFSKPIPFLKQVIGRPGDVYRFENNALVLNDCKLKKIIRKEIGSKGLAMPMIPPGKVPRNHYFVITSHPLSFDSRYFGPVAGNNIIGIAKPIFVWAYR